MYYANVFPDFQSPVSPIWPIYQVLNGLYMPIMYSKFPLLDELLKQVKQNLQADNVDTEDDDDDYFSEEDEFDDELPI